MDAFFASVEQREEPSLRGKPVLVGGTGPRGVVAAASYEARVFGCRSAMPTAVALRLCPSAIVVKGSYGKYREVSDRVFEILGDFTPRVQPLSIDEAFLDVTGCQRLLGTPEAMAARIRERIRGETELTASVGVAPNKFLAKLASDLDKPDGLSVIEPGRIEERLAPLEIERLWGVGPKAAEKLHRLGVRTVGELARVPLETLEGRFGSWGEHLWRLSRGIDDRPVHSDREAKTIGHEQTFGVNLSDFDELRAVIGRHAELVARRLRTHGIKARTVTVKIRFGNFETITRRATLSEATDRTDAIRDSARQTFERWAQRRFQPVRLIGVTASELVREEGSPGLFGDVAGERQEGIDRASDAIVERFGRGAISRGGSIRPQR